MKKNQEKKIAREAMVLRYIRQARKLSLNEAGRRIGITGSAIAHIEQGRMNVSRERLRTMLHAYEVSTEEYLEFFDGRSIPMSTRDECLSLLKKLDDAKLQVVHSLLVNLASPHL